MLGHPREHQNSKNECRAAWERFRKMQNERHAAWERFSSPHGPNWCPQKGPPKTPQTIYFKMVLTFFGAPSEHPSWAHQKMEQPNWAPKSSLGDRAKHLFSSLFFLFLFSGIVLMASPNRPFIFKICNIASVLYMFLMPSLSPCWTTQWQPLNRKTSATLHGNASAKHETSATLHGNSLRLGMVQLRPPKESAAYWKIKFQSAKTENQNLPTLHGNAIAGKCI